MLEWMERLKIYIGGGMLVTKTKQIMLLGSISLVTLLFYQNCSQLAEELKKISEQENEESSITYNQFFSYLKNNPNIVFSSTVLKCRNANGKVIAKDESIKDQMHIKFESIDIANDVESSGKVKLIINIDRPNLQQAKNFTIDSFHYDVQGNTFRVNVFGESDRKGLKTLSTEKIVFFGQSLEGYSEPCIQHVEYQAVSNPIPMTPWSMTKTFNQLDSISFIGDQNKAFTIRRLPAVAGEPMHFSISQERTGGLIRTTREIDTHRARLEEIFTSTQSIGVRQPFSSLNVLLEELSGVDSWTGLTLLRLRDLNGSEFSGQIDGSDLLTVMLDLELAAFDALSPSGSLEAVATKSCEVNAQWVRATTAFRVDFDPSQKDLTLESARYKYRFRHTNTADNQNERYVILSVLDSQNREAHAFPFDIASVTLVDAQTLGLEGRAGPYYEVANQLHKNRLTAQIPANCTKYLMIKR